jgi:NADH-quinone oxidoreductase subunit N
MQHLDNIYLIMPEIFLTVSIVILLAHGVVFSKKEGQVSQQKKITWLAVLALAASIIMTIDIMDVQATSLNGLLGVDTMINLIKVVSLMASIAVLLLSIDYYGKKNNLMDYEYPILILITTLGMMLLVACKDLIAFYLAIEILSLSCYILATIKRNGQFSTEAGIKYFLLGAVSSGILLFGASILYALTGETSFQGLATFMWFAPHAQDYIGLSVGALFILVAVLFKLAAAPFHMWAPDVYEGSPTIVTAFFAIAPKLSLFGILIHLLYGPFFGLLAQLQPFIIFSAIVSVIVGSIGALNQTKFKRLVAYSAIGHTGFILLGIATGSLDSLQASFLYIIIYIIMSINLFAFTLSTFNDFGESNFISQLSGLSRSNPLLALTLALCLFSIAGIPPLAGFFSKYLVLLSLVSNGFIVIASIAVIASVIACFYYLRIIQVAYFGGSMDPHFAALSAVFKSSPSADPFIGSAPRIPVSFISSILLGSTLFFILTFMFFPNPLISLSFDALACSLL